MHRGSCLVLFGRLLWKAFSELSKPLFQSEAKCKAIDMAIISYSHTHFYKKGFALALLVSKVRIFGTRNIAYSLLCLHTPVNLKREAERLDVQQDWGSRKRFKKIRHFGYMFNVKIAFQVESSHVPLRFWSFSAIACPANWKFQMTPCPATTAKNSQKPLYPRQPFFCIFYVYARSRGKSKSFKGQIRQFGPFCLLKFSSADPKRNWKHAWVEGH